MSESPVSTKLVLADWEILRNFAFMKWAVIVRFLIIGLLWAGICGVLVARMVATGTPVNLVTLFPVIASGICIFVPLYKKYIKNDNQRKSNRQ